MGKIILGNLLRHLLTLLIGFFVARHMLSADVAHKLAAGDTVELWGGGWTVSIKQVIDFITLSIIPILVPVLLGAWARIKDKFKIIAALKSSSPTQIKSVVDVTPATQIIKTVAASPIASI